MVPRLPGSEAVFVHVKPEHGTKVLNGEPMNLLNFSSARYRQESGTTNATKHTKPEERRRMDPVRHAEHRFEHRRDSLYASFRTYMSVRMAYVGDLEQEHMRPCSVRRRFRLRGAKKLVFAILFHESSNKMTHTSHRFMVVSSGTGHAVARRGCTPATSTRTCIECRRRFRAIPVGAFKKPSMHHEHACSLERIATRCLKQGWMHELVSDKLAGMSDGGKIEY